MLGLSFLRRLLRRRAAEQTLEEVTCCLSVERDIASSGPARSAHDREEEIKLEGYTVCGRAWVWWLILSCIWRTRLARVRQGLGNALCLGWSWPHICSCLSLRRLCTSWRWRRTLRGRGFLLPAPPGWGIGEGLGIDIEAARRTSRAVRLREPWQQAGRVEYVSTGERYDLGEIVLRGGRVR